MYSTLCTILCLRAKSKHTVDLPRGTITRERLCYMAATLKENIENDKHEMTVKVNTPTQALAFAATPHTVLQSWI